VVKRWQSQRDETGIRQAFAQGTWVTVKNIKQQDLQGLHRIRQPVVKPRTALANPIRGRLGEYGIVVTQGISRVRTRIPEILEDGENGLTDRFRGWLAELLEAFHALDERIKKYDQEIGREHAANEVCQRLSAIEGVGPQSATAVVATYGDAHRSSAIIIDNELARPGTYNQCVGAINVFKYVSPSSR
jgi:transposase